MDPLDDDERAELERLRAQVRAQQERPNPGPGTDPGSGAGPDRARGGRWRGPVAVLLIVLGCLLAPLSVLAVWTNNQVSNTDRYVENVAPLASDPAIRAAVSKRVTTEITGRLQLKQLVGQGVDALESRGLPPKLAAALQGLEPSIVSGVQSFVRQQVGAVVASHQFGQLWVRANRLGHQSMNKILSGQSKAVSINGDTLTLDLGPIIDQVKKRLVDRGFTVAGRIPSVHPTFTLVSSRYLPAMQTGYQWLGRLAWILPVCSLLLIVGGIALHRRRRTALIGAALGVAGGMVLLAIGLAIGRAVYLQKLPSRVDHQAATALFDTLVRFVKDGLRMLLTLGLVVALLAWLSGPSKPAIGLRSLLGKGIERLRFGNLGGFGAWVYAHRTALRIAVVVAAALAFVFWNHPTGKVVLLLAIVAVVLLGVIEVLARPPGGRTAKHGPPPTTAGHAQLG